MIHRDDMDHMVGYARDLDELARLLVVTRKTMLNWVARNRYPLPRRLAGDTGPQLPHRSMHYSGPQERVVCAECGNEFDALVRAKRRFCSHACAGATGGRARTRGAVTS